MRVLSFATEVSAVPVGDLLGLLEGRFSRKLTEEVQ